MNPRAMNQTATYWGAPTPNGVGGHSFSAPRQLKVKWEDKAEEYSNNHGETLVSSTIVYVLEDLEVDGYLFLGTTSETNPIKVYGAHQIKQFTKIPEIRRARSERRAYL